ncbi:MAG: protease inhibitor I42 family protein [Candidatus Micrarchaeia archaeon]|jgi:predicted secreted protein
MKGRFCIGVAFVVLLAASFATAALSWISSTDINLTAISGNSAEYQGDALAGSTFTYPAYANPKIGFTVSATVDNENIIKYIAIKPSASCSEDINDDGSYDGPIYTANSHTINWGCYFILSFRTVGVGSTKIHIVEKRYDTISKTYSSAPILHALVRVSNSAGTNIVTAIPYTTTTPTASPVCIESSSTPFYYCCGAGMRCAKICKNGAYVEEKIAHPGCNIATATPSAYPTPVSLATTKYVKAGEEFKIIEYSNPSTGYDWQVTVANPEIVAYSGAKGIDCNTQVTDPNTNITAVSVGGGCNYAYYFKALATGTTYVKMNYMRSWDSSSVAKSKQVVVVVNGEQPYITVTPTSTSNCKEGEYAPKYCCADGIMCTKTCRNGVFVDEKVESADCKKTVVTQPSATPVSAPMQEVGSTFDIKMQKGWNLFSVPATYAKLAKNTCSRDRIYYYNTGAGKYETKDLKLINWPRAHWFYSTEDCVVAFETISPFRMDNFKAELKAGWNMVSAPYGDFVKASKCEKVPTSNGGAEDKCYSYAEYTPLKIDDYKGSCSITAAYSFDPQANNWVKADALEYKKGYFIKVTENCKMYAPDETTTIPALPE